MCECDRAAELLSRRLDDDPLSRDEEQFLDGHLARCPACAALAEQFSQIHSAFPLLEAAAPAGLKDRIMERVALEGAQPKEKVVSFPARWKRWAAMAAVFALVLLGAGSVEELLSSNSAAPAALYGTAGSSSAAPSPDPSRGISPMSALNDDVNGVGPEDTLDAAKAAGKQAAPAGSDNSAPESSEYSFRCGSASPQEETALFLVLSFRFPDDAVLPQDWLSSCEDLEDGRLAVTLTAPDGTEEVFWVDLAAETVEAAQ